MGDPLHPNRIEPPSSPAWAEPAAAKALRFFGRMSASISHELKNTLSIMNESAGLLEDLALLAEKGRPLDPARVHTLGATIKRQIQRTDQIIRNMNRFAHTVDEPVKQIELVDFLEFILALSQRLISAKGVAVAVHSRDQPLLLVTRPFFLHCLIWRVLEHGMERAGASKNLIITPEACESGVRIRLTGVDVGEDEVHNLFATPPGQMLPALLEAQVSVDSEKKAILLVLPVSIGDATRGASHMEQPTEGATP
jgi:K+-sensing histidine kinase KdpD